MTIGKLFKKVRAWHIFAAGAAAVAALNVAAWQSETFSDWYVSHIFPVWLNTYARLTSFLPFSIGEIMLALAVLITLFGVVFFIVNLICRNRFKSSLKRFGIAYAWLLLAVCWIMTLNCFILYHASDFSEKYMQEADDSGHTKNELASLRDYLVEKCNELSLEIAHDDSGTAYYDGDLVEAAREAMISFGEDYEQLSGFYVTPKFLACSGFFSQQYIMGYYFPFSLEANINSVMYITNVAPTVCHELAHTKGFMNEDDANFIAYLACISSDDVFLQYCGYLSVLNYVNNDFYESIDKSQTVYKTHVRISDTVADDNIFLTKEAWDAVEEKAVVKTSTVKKASDAFMETSLKLNGVEEGMEQYSNVVELLLDYYDGILY